MRCISIHQPWADLIVDSKRKMEIRKWSTSHRGKLLIHAGLKIEQFECGRLSVEPSGIGVILGIVDLCDVYNLSAKDWERLRAIHLEVGPPCYGKETYGWFLSNAERFPRPVAFNGALGLFNVPNKLLPRQFKILKDGKVIESFVPGRFAGWRPGKIFGRLDCKSGLRMKKENRVFFHTWEEALAEDYRPCKSCKPKPCDIYAL